MNNPKILTQNNKKELVFTDKTNFTYGGEIPQNISKHLITDDNCRNGFCKLSSSEKNIFLENCKKISLQNEAKCYVQTLGESRISVAQMGFGEF